MQTQTIYICVADIFYSLLRKFQAGTFTLKNTFLFTFEFMIASRAYFYLQLLHIIQNKIIKLISKRILLSFLRSHVELVEHFRMVSISTSSI